MPRSTSHFQSKEPFLEYLFSFLRYRSVTPHINKGSKVLDLGCGYKGAFLNKISGKIKEGVGVDVSVGKNPNKNILLKKGIVDKPLKLNSKFDCVTSLAVIEHVNDPKTHLTQAYIHLKPGGKLLLTTPSKKSEPLLNFLALKIGIVSKEEIKDHKRYYDSDELENVIKQCGFKNINVKSFEFGYNLFASAQK
jgi:2-polyprenyl-3-methyl-5-hydroxy-6-metoxy-1,4-benzoquinol methylase